MRRRLVLLAVAISLMVALSFVIPLAFLVRDLAQDRALAAGERQAQDIARVIATLTPDRGVVEASKAIAPISDGNLSTSLILPDGSVVGGELLPGESPTLAITGTAFRTAVGGDQIIYTPVIQEDGETVVVRVVVSEAALSEGVMQSWEVLAGVAVTLVVLGVVAAAILGRSIIGPVQALADSAALLGEGDLSVRIEPAGPHEIQEAAIEFNRLAERISRLVQRERDAAADLSHRLRTPITALRLDMDGVEDSPAMTRVWEDLDILERTVDFLIRHSLRPVSPDSVSDFAAVLTERVAFWAPLAREQGRDVTVSIGAGEAMVRSAEHDLEAMIDVLFDNVFAHSFGASPLAVTLRRDRQNSYLTFEDGGPGFSSTSVLGRGSSGSSSTGLGLDIVRSTAEGAGGSVSIGSSQSLGGARIEVRLPLVA